MTIESRMVEGVGAYKLVSKSLRIGEVLQFLASTDTHCHVAVANVYVYV